MDMTHDTTEPSRDTTVDVAEAARRLGISEDAVRARIRRGKLRGEKVGPIWQVYLEPGDMSHETTVSHATRQDSDAADTPPAETEASLIEHLQGEVAYLRDELAKRSEELAKERERSDVLQREALGRIEALTATIKATESPERMLADAKDAGEAGEVVADRTAQRDADDLLARLWRVLRGA